PSAPRLLGSITAPFINFHHSGWPSEDGKFLFICNELAPQRDPELTVWDIRDPGNPQFVAEFSDRRTNIHNLYIIGNFAYTSYYNAGFRVFDVSDPANPVLAGEFDTSPDVDTGSLFQGAFGAYPFTPSGNIYVSDIQGGLHIFSFKPNGSSNKLVAP
ncbi:MAG: LVIVD repeat-containing protein, partial [bacterium]